jgi:hypothetical protein
MIRNKIYKGKQFGFWYESMMFSLLAIGLRNALRRLLRTSGAFGEINYAATNSAAVRGSTSVNQSSLNTKIERKQMLNVKPVLVEQHCTAMNDDARANASTRLLSHLKS